MPRRRNRNSARRRALAAEAARIISEQGVIDFEQAKRKAAQRLGLQREEDLPRNTEVELALRENQSLFGGEERRAHLRRLREGALEAMRYLEDFRPRLVGPVLEGTADQHSAIQLHVFADIPELFALFLEERRIPHDMHERAVQLERRREAPFPVFQFEAGGLPYDITCLPLKALRQPPLSPVTGRTMKRASAHALRELLAGDSAVA